MDTVSEAFAFANNASRTIGYQTVVYYDPNIKTDAWHTPSPLKNGDVQSQWRNVYDQFSAKHQSVLDPFNNLPLFMGGEYRVNSPQNATNALPQPFGYVKAFNTENVWSYITFTGDMPAPGRLYSTSTLYITFDKFGGELNDKAVSVDKNTVLIIWGIDKSNIGTSSMLILDATDPHSIKLNGVKAGIAVAGAAVLVLVALFIWLCIRKKKRDREMKEKEREISKQQRESGYFNRTDVEHMEVDWDEIDKKCTEMPTRKGNYTEDGVDHVVGIERSTTLVSKNETPSATIGVILPDGIETNRPNTVDSAEPSRLLKPDGGH
ncbi:hypothetical protein [Parasitella parasitica]|uniref:Uncharacterized protein n=1 Tax=Parasitella parasitica TaxID=35722 RepID=A0A0B7NID1_9FUNG|nr:hypothetical protein [Parasitella parasitica]